MNKTEDLWGAISQLPIVANMALSEVMKLDTPPLSSWVMKTEEGADKERCYKFIRKMLLDLCKFFGNAWSDFQVIESAKTMYDNYYYLSPADWRLFERRCIALVWGKIFGAFTPAVLMEWVGNFVSERDELVVNETLAEHDKQRSSEQKFDN